MDRIKVKCTKCELIYQFKSIWAKKNNLDTFICRKCKIIESTRSDKFKLECKKRSKELFLSNDLRSRVSQSASLSNEKNKDRISISLIEHFKDEKNRKKISEISKKNWQDQNYKKNVHDKLTEKWQDPLYRGKILGSRSKSRSNIQLIKLLKERDIPFIKNFYLGMYCFEILIRDNILFDKTIQKQKQIFLNHFFPNYIYTNDTKII
jgi:hypothetical protein